MKRTKPMAVVAILLLTLTLFSTACSSGDDTAAPRAMPTESLIAEDYGEVDATIQAIDTETRGVTLRTADGKVDTITAPADVDLSKLEAGDVVTLGAYQRLSVKALPAGSAPLGTRTQVAEGRAAPGETPGRGVAQVTSTVTEIAAIDTDSNSVTLRAADGSTRTLSVRNPDNQRKLKELEVGDLVQIDFLEAVTATLRPKP